MYNSVIYVPVCTGTGTGDIALCCRACVCTGTGDIALCLCYLAYAWQARTAQTAKICAQATQTLGVDMHDTDERVSVLALLPYCEEHALYTLSAGSIDSYDEYRLQDLRTLGADGTAVSGALTGTIFSARALRGRRYSMRAFALACVWSVLIPVLLALAVWAWPVVILAVLCAITARSLHSGERYVQRQPNGYYAALDNHGRVVRAGLTATQARDYLA